jgi:hypothetical protein
MMKMKPGMKRSQHISPRPRPRLVVWEAVALH